MTTAERCRDSARTMASVYGAWPDQERERLTGRIEGVLIAAHLAERTPYSPDGVRREAEGYIAAGRQAGAGYDVLPADCTGALIDRTIQHDGDTCPVHEA